MFQRLSFVGWKDRNTSAPRKERGMSSDREKVILLNQSRTSSDELEYKSNSDIVMRGTGSDTVEALEPFRKSKPPKSKSSLLSRRLSSSSRPASTSTPPPKTSVRTKTTSDQTQIQTYAQRSSTISRSSPDVTTKSSRQPWPTRSSDSNDATQSNIDLATEDYASRRIRGLSVNLRYHSTSLLHRERLHEETEDAMRSDDDTTMSDSPSPAIPPLRANDLQRTPPSPLPRISFDRSSTSARSISPQPTDLERDAARAAAFAKLTESVPSSSRLSSSDSIPFPTKYPAPTRQLPPVPVSLAIKRSVSVRSRGDAVGIENEMGFNKSRLRPRHHSASASSPQSFNKISTPLTSYPAKLRTTLQPPLHSRSLQSQPSALFDLQRDTEMLESTIDATIFLEHELGRDVVRSRINRREDENYEDESKSEENMLWLILQDGVVLCQLLNHLSIETPPIPLLKIDTRYLPAAALSNLSLFLTATSLTYYLSTSDLFLPSDIISGHRSGFRRVLHTLSILQRLTEQSQTSSPLPSEINSKGRVVRERNGGSPGHGRDGSGSTDPTHSSPSDADSSKFTDYSFDSMRGKTPDSNVTFIDRVRERDRDKEWGGRAGGSSSRNKIYAAGGDRRMTESTIDVMTVVEEDGSPNGIRRRRSQSRHSQPVFLSSAARFPSLGGEGFVIPRRDQRHNSFTPPVRALSIDTGFGLATPRVRSRRSSDARPSLSPTSRTLSHSAMLTNATERETRGPSREVATELSRTSSSRTVRRHFEMESPPSLSGPFDSVDLLPSPIFASSSVGPPIRPGQHQRWNSELTPMSEHDGVRSRHQSLMAANRQGAEEKRAARTKLVLREDGHPTLTYQLGECIGRGQFGSVYRALNLSSGRCVAVKRIELQGKTEEEVLQLSNEIEVLKDLSHPGVVSYEGVVRTENYVNIILEYVENGSLQKTLKHFGELPEGLVASYVVKILEGLDYLHSKNVVHCDLKCANILSTKNGNIKLSDFGVSLNLNAVQNLNDANVNGVNGTPNWMAPEVIQMRGASTASDVWSLGCTIIELISGRPPYAELNTMSAMFRIVEDDHPPIPERCSLELSDFLLRCFAKEASDRPTAVELGDHIWLQKNWNPYQDLRAQDSIPFLRRISADPRRSDSMGPVFTDAGFFAGSPLLRPQLFDSPLRPSFDLSRSSSDITPSSEAAESTSVVNLPILEPTPTESVVRSHSFVKSTFSKAVACKLCHELVRRHALLCEFCGVITHKTCGEALLDQSTPFPCDIRAQLHLSSRATNVSPTSPRLSSSSGFNLNEYLPFGRSKKLKLTSSASIPDLPPLLVRDSRQSSVVNGASEIAHMRAGSNTPVMRTSQSIPLSPSLPLPSRVAFDSSPPPPPITSSRTTATKLHRRKSVSNGGNQSFDQTKIKSDNDNCIVS